MLEQPSALHFRFCREGSVLGDERAQPREADSADTRTRPSMGRWVAFRNLRSSSCRQEASQVEGEVVKSGVRLTAGCEGNLFKAALGLKAAGRWQGSHRVTAHTALAPRLRELWGPERRKQLGWEEGPSAEAGGRWSQEEEKMRLVLRSICPSPAPTERL